MEVAVEVRNGLSFINVSFYLPWHGIDISAFMEYFQAEKNSVRHVLAGSFITDNKVYCVYWSGMFIAHCITFNCNETNARKNSNYVKST